MTSTINQRVAQIEDAIVRARGGDFDIVHVDGERYLRPILAGHVADVDAIQSYPLIRISTIAREIERLTS